MTYFKNFSITINSLHLFLFCLPFLTACNSGSSISPSGETSTSTSTSSSETLTSTDAVFSFNLPADITVKAGNIVELSPKINEESTAIVTYQWEQTSGSLVSLTPENEPYAEFTALVNDNLTFNLIATDGEGNQYSDTINITVLPADEILTSVTLSWSSPLYNTDGSELTNLAGYRIYYGQSATQLDMLISVNDPELSAYNIDNLVSGTNYFFSITAFNSAGYESDRTDTVTLAL